MSGIVTITLDSDERDELKSLLEVNLEYYHETLRSSKTVAAALEIFDANPTVRILKQIAPESCESIRNSIEEDIKDYLD